MQIDNWVFFLSGSFAYYDALRRGDSKSAETILSIINVGAPHQNFSTGVRKRFLSFQTHNLTWFFTLKSISNSVFNNLKKFWCHRNFAKSNLCEMPKNNVFDHVSGGGSQNLKFWWPKNSLPKNAISFANTHFSVISKFASKSLRKTQIFNILSFLWIFSGREPPWRHRQEQTRHPANQRWGCAAEVEVGKKPQKEVTDKLTNSKSQH